MTGYGRAVERINDSMVTAEIKSVNSKTLELNLRLPALYKDKEQELRALVSPEIERGKVDIHISFANAEEAQKVFFNRKVIKAYIDELHLIEKKFNLSAANPLELVLGWPDAMSMQKQESGEQGWEHILLLIKKATREFHAFRLKEGKATEKDLLLRIKNILHHLRTIEKQVPRRLADLQNRLKNMLSANKNILIDENRFEQELIYYIEKMDITEEAVRLRIHCEYFLQTVKEPSSNGKKLGFILQEAGREINTIGAKANDAIIQHKVIELKDELEKMKEQMSNIL